MAKLQLVQATAENGVWDRLRTAWEKQVKEHGAPDQWAQPFLDHAENVVRENGLDDRYGIYVACGTAGKDGGASVPYEGFVHVNFKLINTPGAEIRLVWNRIAPRYQFEDLRDEVAEIQATFLIGALRLSESN